MESRCQHCKGLAPTGQRFCSLGCERCHSAEVPEGILFDTEGCAGICHGGPPGEVTYESLALEIARLVESKQAAYGDSFGKSGAVMRAFYPDGVKPEQLDDALTIVRVVDKLFRIATDRDAFGEDPWQDVEGYALLARRRRALQRAGAPKL